MQPYMGKSSLQQILRELEVFVQTGHRASDLFQRAAEKIAPFLLDAFYDEKHPLSVELESLRGLVLEHDAYWKSKEGRKEIRKSREELEAVKTRRTESNLRPLAPPSLDANGIFFTPQPGSSRINRRRFWPLQLLLCLAANSEGHRKKLADVLLLSPESLRKAYLSGTQASIAAWSLPQYAHHLVEALKLFIHVEPQLSYRRKDREVNCAGGSFRLSLEEMTMLTLLEENLGRAVTYGTFREAGVANPTQRKKRLLSKFAAAGVDLRIQHSPNAYTLLPSAD